MKIFYHRADFDGIGSAAVMRKHLRDTGQLGPDPHMNIEFIGADYPDNIKPYLDIIQDGEVVWFVDYIFEPLSAMTELAKRARVCVIDHHLTSINYFKDPDIYDLFETVYIGNEANTISAVELCWNYLHTPTIENQNPAVPRVVDMLSKYDTWNHGGNTDILNFQLGIRIENVKYTDDEIWDKFLTVQETPEIQEFIRKYINMGAIMSKAEESAGKFTANEGCFEMDFHGYKAIILNSTKRGSFQFKSVFDPAKHDLCMAFTLLKNGWWTQRCCRI